MQNSLNLHIDPSGRCEGQHWQASWQAGRQSSEKLRFANSTSEYEYENRNSFKSWEKCKEHPAYSTAGDDYNF